MNNRKQNGGVFLGCMDSIFTVIIVVVCIALVLLVFGDKNILISTIIVVVPIALIFYIAVRLVDKKQKEKMYGKDYNKKEK